MSGDLRRRKGITLQDALLAVLGSSDFGFGTLSLHQSRLYCYLHVALFQTTGAMKRIQATISACWPPWRSGGIPAEHSVSKITTTPSAWGLPPSRILRRRRGRTAGHPSNDARVARATTADVFPDRPLGLSTWTVRE